MSEAILDLEKLLAPIEGDSSVGRNIRDREEGSDYYYRIKNLRSRARRAERKKIQEGEKDFISPKDWEELKDECIKALCETTKDLEVASWLTEAMLRLHGFGGLKESFILLGRLIESFWPDIYPVARDDGLLSKIGAVENLNGTEKQGALVAIILHLPLTDEKAGNGPFSYWHYRQAKGLEKMDAKKRKIAVESGVVELSVIKNTAKLTSTDFFKSVRSDIEESKNAFDTLSNIISGRIDSYIFPTSFVDKSLTRCLNFVGSFIKKRESKEELTSVGSEEKISDVVGKTDVVDSREVAFRELGKIAEYFKKAEPHSPISYMLEKTIKWGNLSLDKLIREMLMDDVNAQYNLYKMLGIDPEPEKQESMQMQSDLGSPQVPPQVPYQPMGSPSSGGMGGGYEPPPNFGSGGHDWGNTPGGF